MGETRAWTPGPWKVADLDRRCIVEDDGDSVIADVREWRNPANADLIAAAPDLYEALLATRSSLTAIYHMLRRGELPGPSLMEDDARLSLQEAATALAAARGESTALPVEGEES